ncbi:glyoxalase/bleomycin resistance protein/dioxygenase superfamily protein [Paenibacillus taihuensis]|uniref:Glyoxalase/bleomycin resistance protein/dioxygenase superfamily protein n=1 Tax=Paenibacillus taihuensis TaxID=1156355 RepID=A0A3D9S086_9BACL|nr:VOC family protein [Paenibacillus taihuensis]REE85138.1 glyoxalase/bleomycin resistance protein/dioxygenase superfamily protein [Paenibacillus taihuensis]
MSKTAIAGPTMVLLVRDLERSTQFYKELGFQYELVGGPDVQHVHMKRDQVAFILHEAVNPQDVRPNSSVQGGLYFDAFCYGDVRQLLEEIREKNIPIVRGPDLNDFFSEFTIEDVDGYRIAFGG